MQRHGWAFCLGLLAIGTAVAQPPADSERYPPAPELPGVVVGQTATTILAADKSVTPPSELPFEPIHPPKDKPAIKESTPTEATPAPATAGPATCTNAGPVCKTACCAGCIDRIATWLMHKSRAKQQGHYVTPYCPPLYAWFPCEPRSGSCGKSGCAPLSPTIIPPTELSMVPPTAAIPKNPVTLAPEPPTLSAPKAIESQSDLPPGFQKIDVGLSFTPGAAPMAKPTTQAEKVSNWRPK